MSWKRITAELRELERGAALVERVCRGVAAKARGGEPDPFSVAMGAWLGDAVAQQEALQALLSQTRRLYVASAARLGIDAGKDGDDHGPEKLFELLATFRTQWAAAQQANAAAAAREARELHLAEQREALRAAAAARREARAARKAAAASAAGGQSGEREGPAPRGRRGPAALSMAGARRAKLPFNTKASRSKATVAGAGGSGKECRTCGRRFVAFGPVCPTCRASKRRGPPAAPTGDACFVCSRKVYDAERLVAAGRLFHRKSPGHPGCFRCAHCDVTLSATSFSCAPSRRRFFCQNHFKQLFAMHGNYDFAEGGGEEEAEAEQAAQAPPGGGGGDGRATAPTTQAVAAAAPAAEAAAEAVAEAAVPEEEPEEPTCWSRLPASRRGWRVLDTP